MKTSRFSLLVAGLMLSLSLFAQQNKTFTLEELIPGGKHFYDFYPRLTAQYQWSGDNLIQVEKDTLWTTDFAKKNAQRKFFLSLSSIQDKLNDKTDKVMRTAFDKANPSHLYFYTQKGQGVYHLTTKEVLSYFIYPEKAENMTLSPNGDFLAYTKENNLYVLDKKERKPPFRKSRTRALFTDKRCIATNLVSTVEFFGRPMAVN